MEYKITVTEPYEYCGKICYTYLFSTTIDNCAHAKRVYNLLKLRFPEPDYKIDITKWEKFGRPIENFGEND